MPAMSMHTTCTKAECNTSAEASTHLLALQLLLANELQLGQEGLRQVAVLQHHPEALLHSFINPALRHGPLALPQADHLHPPPLLLRKLQQRCCWITAREPQLMRIFAMRRNTTPLCYTVLKLIPTLLLCKFQQKCCWVAASRPQLMNIFATRQKTTSPCNSKLNCSGRASSSYFSCNSSLCRPFSTAEMLQGDYVHSSKSVAFLGGRPASTG